MERISSNLLCCLIEIYTQYEANRRWKNPIVWLFLSPSLFISLSFRQSKIESILFFFLPILFKEGFIILIIA